MWIAQFIKNIGQILHGNFISIAIIIPLGTCQGRRSAVGVCIFIWTSEAAARTGMFHIFQTPGREGGCLKRKNNDREILLCRDKNFVGEDILHNHAICQTLLNFPPFEYLSDSFCQFRMGFVVFLFFRRGLSPSAKVIEVD